MRKVVPVKDTHWRYLQLIASHGTGSERKAAVETLEIMKLVRSQHPEGTWEPMEIVLLPEVLRHKAKQMGRRRHQAAKRWKLRNKHGVIRTLDEEIRTSEAQLAACLILGYPFGDKLTHQTAKRDGNIGSNCSAFAPRVGNYSLLITEKEKRGRWMFLMLDNGPAMWRCAGFCRAGEFMRPEYQHTFVRDGWEANPYLVPPEQLSPIRNWWAA